MEDARLRTGIDRRTLVKAGVATAWAVPLVQVVAAAPASASVVSGPANLSTSTGSITRSGNTYTVAVTVTNTGSSATQNLAVTMSVSGKPTIKTDAPGQGWAGGYPNWVATTPLAGGESRRFELTFTTTGVGNTEFNVTFSVTTDGGTSGAVSGTFK